MRVTQPDRIKEIEANCARSGASLTWLITLVVDGRAPQRVAEEIAAREKKVREIELERETCGRLFRHRGHGEDHEIAHRLGLGASVKGAERRACFSISAQMPP